MCFNLRLGMESIVHYSAMYVVIWFIPFLICHSIYFWGSKDRLNKLINIFSSNPLHYDKFGGVLKTSFGAGGIFLSYTLLYPFKRYKAKNVKISLDILMWLHWFWWVNFIIFIIYSFFNK